MAERQQRAYLAGPMRGYPLHNFPAFHAAAALLRAAGYVVCNPAEMDTLDPAAPRTQAQLRRLLNDDLAWICEHADLVVTLDGWQDSKGARAEVATAKALDLPVWPLDIALHQARQQRGGERDA